jgi:DNA repair protein RecN (Recombination protein N)
MLASLIIKNYALIDNLNVNLQNGFTTITGETGAGKSILLGGLNLILGKRADYTSLLNPNKKCIIEGEFLIKKYHLKSFFIENDLDFEDRTVIRREILPNGKSRAFINDTPTTLNILTSLGEKLIDIHSQQQTLVLNDKKFQFLIVDALADNSENLIAYKDSLNAYKKKSQELLSLIEIQKEAQEQQEYNSFLLQELKEANFKKDEQESLENTLDKLNHTEEIKGYLSQILEVSNDENVGIKHQLYHYLQVLNKLRDFDKDYEVMSNRMESVRIEFQDITDELEKLSLSIDYSPSEIEQYNNRLQLLYDLFKKHQITTIDNLIKIQDKLQAKVDSVTNASETLESKRSEINLLENKLNELANKISDKRKRIIPDLKRKLEKLLADLEMTSSSFKFNLKRSDSFLNNGKDELDFLISTNKGGNYKNLKKIISGGEMSRIMLAVKSILSKYRNLPTIIFDEIDSGVSGEVAKKIAAVMSKMSKNMQVIAITHLPQIAAQGNQHFKVYKKEIDNMTFTKIKVLNHKERIEELAEMLGGKKLEDSAIRHARQLLKQ